VQEVNKTSTGERGAESNRGAARLRLRAKRLEIKIQRKGPNPLARTARKMRPKIKTETQENQARKGQKKEHQIRMAV